MDSLLLRNAVLITFLVVLVIVILCVLNSKPQHKEHKKKKNVIIPLLIPEYRHEEPVQPLECSCFPDVAPIFDLDVLAVGSGGAFAEGSCITFKPSSNELFISTGPPNQPTNQFMWKADISNPSIPVIGPNLFPSGYNFTGGGDTDNSEIYAMVWHEVDQLLYIIELTSRNLWSLDVNGQNEIFIGTINVGGSDDFRGLAIDPITNNLFTSNISEPSIIYFVDRTDASTIQTYSGITDTVNGAISFITALSFRPSTGELWAAWNIQGENFINNSRIGILDLDALTLTPSCTIINQNISSMTFDQEENLWYTSSDFSNLPLLVVKISPGPCLEATTP